MRNLLSQLQKPAQPAQLKKQLAVAVLWAALLMGLSACGNKGELYLPEKNDNPKEQTN